MIWAKKVGKIEDAGYGKPYVVAYLSAVFYTLMFMMVVAIMLDNPADALKIVDEIGMFGTLIVNLGLFTLSHTLAGKLLYKVSFGQAFKATLILPLIQTVLTLVSFGALS